MDMLRDYTISEIICALHARVTESVEKSIALHEKLEAARADGNIDEEKRLFVVALEHMTEAAPYYGYLRSIMEPGESLAAVHEFEEFLEVIEECAEAYEKQAKARG